MAEILSAEEYGRLRAIADRHAAFVDTRRGKNGWAAFRPEEVPEDCRIENGELSALEVYEFVNDPPERYFAYVDARWKILTTWTGDKLGDVTFGTPWVDNFGGRRVPITVAAINGRRYYGTYFESSGNYARIRACRG